jgi:GH35 family endo-1,4-beta-xylanase
MKQFDVAITNEQILIRNVKKAALYFMDAINLKDYESANLELEELKFLVKSLDEMEQKRERRKMLASLIEDMKKRGIKIDFACRSSFFKINAKNVGESTIKIANKHKKRQQA